MDYADAVAAFFVPRQEGTGLPVAIADGSPARRLRDACEPVAMHAVWSRTTNERLTQLGLDFLTSYVGGRGASLGDPAGAVVAAACSSPAFTCPTTSGRPKRRISPCLPHGSTRVTS